MTAINGNVSVDALDKFLRIAGDPPWFRHADLQSATIPTFEDRPAAKPASAWQRHPCSLCVRGRRSQLGGSVGRYIRAYAVAGETWGQTGHAFPHPLNPCGRNAVRIPGIKLRDHLAFEQVVECVGLDGGLAAAGLPGSVEYCYAALDGEMDSLEARGGSPTAE